MFRLRLATRDGRPAGDAAAVDAAAFRTQILPHLDAAYNLARYLVRDPVLAEDVVQDAFLRAHRSFAQFAGASPRAWLFAIVRNCCWTALAQQRGIARVETGDADEAAQLADPAPSAEESAMQAQEIETLRRMVLALPEPFRETLVLREMNELSYREIAAVTGVAIGTVMSRLSRARAMLAELMLPVAASAALQGRGR